MIGWTIATHTTGILERSPNFQPLKLMARCYILQRILTQWDNFSFIRKIDKWKCLTHMSFMMSPSWYPKIRTYRNQGTLHNVLLLECWTPRIGANKSICIHLSQGNIFPIGGKETFGSKLIPYYDSMNLNGRVHIKNAKLRWWVYKLLIKSKIKYKKVDMNICRVKSLTTNTIISWLSWIMGHLELLVQHQQQQQTQRQVSLAPKLPINKL